MYHTRAGGHNILPFLEYFNDRPEYEFHFAYSLDRTYYPQKCRIVFHKISFGIPGIFRTLKVIRGEYDLIWYHGGHSAIIFYLFTLLRAKKSLFVFNIWNEWLIQKAQKGGIGGYLFKKAVQKSDVIQCTWHGTEKLLRNTGWNQTIKTFYWGLHKDYFESGEIPPTPFTSSFLKELPAEKTKFFFPKSISSASRHDLIIEASRKLLEDGIQNFIVYFWMGNVNNPDIKNQLQSKIEKQGLGKHVVIKEHDFLPFSDIIHIWKQMDVGLQIAANDQLSTTFVEPQFFMKYVIATDIEPYRIYNEIFKAELNLCALNANAVAKHMKEAMHAGKANFETLEHRKNIVEKNFNFDLNIGKMVDFYQQKKIL